MNIAELRELDTATVPVEDIPRIRQQAEAAADALKSMLADTETVITALQARTGFNEINWQNIRKSDIPILDDEMLRTAPIDDIPKACKRLDAIRVYAKNLSEDAESALKTLNARVQAELLTSMDKAVYPEGTYTKKYSAFMKLPEGGWPTVFGECIRRVTEDNVAVDEAFSWINFHRLNPKPFADIEDPAELPIGMSRYIKTTTSFKPSKK